MTRFLAGLALALAITGTAAAEPPALHTQQQYIGEVMRATTLDVTDPLAVFGFVLDSLPERVKVYPTENYYYFTFYHHGIEYAGNIRLDASDRDQGKVQFGYYEQTTLWRDETPGYFRVLDASSGVKLEKVERFLYRLTYKEKSVLFELNDLSQVRPPEKAVAQGERFIGPVFDESGVRFFLMYHPSIKNFLFVLDETAPPSEEYVGAERDSLLLGKRTGFVFYRDDRLDRKILVGVYDDNVRINNYFDGPFDQLPDNFIEGETLRDALLEIDPSLKGKIDRFGGSADGAVRYVISPYLAYKEIGEFKPLNRCASRNRKHDEASYYRCFILDHEKQDLSARPPAN